MASRRKARELALQFLYQVDISACGLEEALPLFWAVHPAAQDTRDYASGLIRGTRSRLAEIDPLLARYADNWALERMAAVDRTLLRIAVYEMLFAKSAPPVVVINEAVDIAKRFSTSDSGGFVNGILDRIRKERLPDVS